MPVSIDSLEVPSPADVINPAIVTQEASDNHGLFHIEPLRRGFAHTLGTPMRRVLLSSLPGAAISTARIDGALHEFSTLEFMREDVVEFLLNVKRVRLRSYNSDPSSCSLVRDKIGVITAGDIEAPSGVEILNPDHYLGEMTGKGPLQCEFSVVQGVGYVAFEQGVTLPIGVIPLDSVFTPVTKVEYRVEQARVGQDTEYDRLILEVWTDGTTSPHDALRLAAQQLAESFGSLATVDDTPEALSGELKTLQVVAASEPLEDLRLSNRAMNCLKRHGLETIQEVAALNRDELFALRGMGVRLVDEIRDVLAERGIALANDGSRTESA